MWISGLGLSSLVGSSITVENTFACVFESTPVHGDLPPRCGSVKFRLPLISNRFLIPSKSKKNASLRLPAKQSVGARLDDIRLGGEGDLGVGDDLRPYRFGRARLRARRREYANGLPAVLRLREHIAERDVCQVIAVGID